ncbi:hypothetical protein Dtox_4231 [Desulfofarcimen acetoxidans DSM 771]|uniref:Uncharacterized protein n=1 Tax=Desulfofarcimen acetoxidans (strain ATCC 49208 / DSM 771 / KCTC 5769 / VKM B-1644 / 5575) TaxID=485916 RepID=C8VZF3_DESAS|nr:hypothetical protein [Desulfofarcimen acetoxidans]ACV64898.1 hypothetical protein Dtox_4231 [Desulfofarcimen acetoxidans DSM 771]
MIFTITGIPKNVPDAGRVSIVWNNGEITGDEFAVVLLRIGASIREKYHIPVDATPTGPSYYRDLLKNPIALKLLAYELFNDLEFSGDEILFEDDDEDLPEGTIY